MPVETRQRILDVALKVFAREGYHNATMKLIADEAGFSEMTLFRKFETKKNLFDQVMLKGVKKFEKDLFSIIDDDFEDPREFLRTFTKKYAKFTDDNFEFIKIIALDPMTDACIGELVAKYVPKIIKYIEKNIKNDNIDPLVLYRTLNGFLYWCSNDKYVGRQLIDYEEFVDKFANNLVQCV